jgi:hypothetical protein
LSWHRYSKKASSWSWGNDCPGGLSNPRPERVRTGSAEAQCIPPSRVAGRCRHFRRARGSVSRGKSGSH